MSAAVVPLAGPEPAPPELVRLVEALARQAAAEDYRAAMDAQLARRDARDEHELA